jgi:murein DD-endopeptidase MepM/ murein hydrolase activator NlpD
VAFESIVQGGGVLTQDFGRTAYAVSCGCEWTCPGYPGGSFHAGIDVSRGGSNILLLAAGYGQVVRIGRLTSGCGGLGPYAPCVRSGGVDIWYGHAAKCLIGAGTFVVPGQPIAIMGSIGCSTGTHVHFEVVPANWDPNGCGALNPWAYVTSWPGVRPGQPPAPPPAAAPPPSSVGPLMIAIGGAALLYAASRTAPRP